MTKLKRIFILILFLIAATLAVANIPPAKVNLIVTEMEMPLVFLILGNLLLGLLIGWLLGSSYQKARLQRKLQ